MTVVLFCSLARRSQPRSLAYHVCGTTTHTPIQEPRIHRRSSHSGVFSHDLIISTQQMLETAHSVSGLPWWLMVVSGTIILRTALTAPFSVWSAKGAAKIDLVKPALEKALESDEFQRSMEEVVSRAREAGYSEKLIEKQVFVEKQRFTRDFFKEHGNPPRSIPFPLVIKNAVVQFPLFTTLTLTLWNMTGYELAVGAVNHIPSPGMLTEQFLWMLHLAIPDTHYVIPFLLLVTNSLNVAVRHARTDTDYEKGVAWKLGHGYSLLVSLVASQAPAIVSLYWLTSSASALLQTAALRNPAVLRRLGVPKTPEELNTPVFRHMWLNFVARQRERPW